MTENGFDYQRLTEMPFGLEGKIFRSPMPYGAYDPRQAVLDEALAEGVSMVVDLVPDDEALQKTGKALRALYQEKGLSVIYAPITDFLVPQAGVLSEALFAAEAELRQGHSVMVHCNAGFGRTGIFMGCLARRVLGLDGPQAVAWVRQTIPTALENEQQVEFVHTFEQ